MSGALLFNGRPRAAALGHSRGLHYGDGVFRTCLVDEGRVLDLPRQVGKLVGDARALGLRPPAAARLLDEARRLAAGHRRAVLKMMLVRAGRVRGYAPQTDRADRLLQVTPAPRYPAAYWTRGIRVARSPVSMARQDLLAGIKHLNRLEQVLALRACPRQATEVLLGGPDGGPVSGARTNLFWVRRGRLHTPMLDHCGIAGQMRDKVLALARRLAIPATEVRARWDDLRGADEVFVCNSLVGIWPVRRFGDRRWRAPGMVTQRLSAALDHPRLEDR